MRPPSFWNFLGSRRNSTISLTSSLASSIPATSAKVTLFLSLERMRALLLPKLKADFPAMRICCRKKKYMIRIKRTKGSVPANACHIELSMTFWLTLGKPLAARSCSRSRLNSRSTVTLKPVSPWASVRTLFRMVSGGSNFPESQRTLAAGSVLREISLTFPSFK